MDILNLLVPIFSEYGYLAVFLMLLICGFGIPIPEDITLVTGGVIVGLGNADLTTMIIVGLIGVIVGDGIMFSMGRFLGKKIQKKYWFCKIMPPARFEKAQVAFHKYGKYVMFIARFLPGVRTPIFFSAGMSHRISFLTWISMDGIAALISVPVWIYLGVLGAENFDWVIKIVHRFQHAILIILAVVVAYIFLRFLKNHKK